MSSDAKQLLLRSVTLGLALAAGALAHANGLASQRPATHSAQVEAHKAALQAQLNRHAELAAQRAELTALAVNPIDHDPRLLAVHNYINRFTQGATGVQIGKRDGAIIEVRRDGVYVVESAGTARKAAAEDLQSAGIGNKQAFLAAVNQRLHELSGVAEGPSSEVHALQTLTKRVQEVDALLPTLTAHADVKLLRDHHTQVTQRRGSAANSVHLLGTEGGEEVHVNGGNLHFIKDGKPAPLDHVVLARLGLSSRADIDRHVAKRVVHLAGVAGDPNDPAVLTAARAALQTQIDEVAQLQRTVENPVAATPDIAFIRTLHQKMPPSLDGKPREVVIAEAPDGSSLQVRKIQTRVAGHQQFGRAVQWDVSGRVVTQSGAVERVVIVDARSPAGREATIAELHRFGIDNKADFDVAVGDAIMRIAPEDLPQ